MLGRKQARHTKSDQPVFNVLVKNARFCETALKLLKADERDDPTFTDLFSVLSYVSFGAARRRSGGGGGSGSGKKQKSPGAHVSFPAARIFIRLLCFDLEKWCQSTLS